MRLRRFDSLRWCPGPGDRPGHLGIWSAGAAAEPKRGEIRSATPKLSAMRVGIDFGTTHTVAAVVERGNYPVVSFDGVDTWPSLIAANDGGELRFGLDAAAVRSDPGSSVLRSFKRLLSDAGPRTTLELAGRCYTSEETDG